MEKSNVLYELTNGIEETKLLEEITTLYETLFTDEKQYEISILIEVLNQRIETIAIAFATLHNYKTIVVNNLEQLMVNLNNVHATIAVRNSYNASVGFDTKFNGLCTDNMPKVASLCASFSKLFLSYNTQTFKEFEIDIDEVKNNLGKLKDLIDKYIYQSDWVLKQLKAVDNTLESFIKKTDGKKWRKSLATIFKEFKNTAISVEKIAEYILNRKASNPLVNEEIVELSIKAATDFYKIIDDFKTTINNLYKYETLTENTKQTIANYLLFSKKT